MGGQRQPNLGSWTNISLESESSSEPSEQKISHSPAAPPDLGMTRESSSISSSSSDCLAEAPRPSRPAAPLKKRPLVVAPEDVWRSDPAMSLHRHKMSKAICEILQERTQRSEREVMPKAQQLESQLFKSAKSLGDYIDRASLRRRVRMAADWRSNNPADMMKERKRMTLQVFKFLEGRAKKNGTLANVKDVKQQRHVLLQMSRQCEVSLFRQAASLEDYNDTAGLKLKLRSILDCTLAQRQEG